MSACWRNSCSTSSSQPDSAARKYATEASVRCTRSASCCCKSSSQICLMAAVAAQRGVAGEGGGEDGTGADSSYTARHASSAICSWLFTSLWAGGTDSTPTLSYHAGGSKVCVGVTAAEAANDRLALAGDFGVIADGAAPPTLRVLQGDSGAGFGVLADAGEMVLRGGGGGANTLPPPEASAGDVGAPLRFDCGTAGGRPRTNGALVAEFAAAPWPFKGLPGRPLSGLSGLPLTGLSSRPFTGLSGRALTGLSRRALIGLSGRPLTGLSGLVLTGLIGSPFDGLIGLAVEPVLGVGAVAAGTTPALEPLASRPRPGEGCPTWVVALREGVETPVRAPFDDFHACSSARISRVAGGIAEPTDDMLPRTVQAELAPTF